MFTFISSPYKHKNPDVVEARVKLTKLYANTLIKRGMLVYSPIVYATAFKSLAACEEIPESVWVGHSMYMLASAARIVILEIKGYMESVGIAAEIAFAELKDIPITYSSELEIKPLTVEGKLEEERLRLFLSNNT